jgi:hypothetical protein
MGMFIHFPNVNTTGETNTNTNIIGSIIDVFKMILECYWLLPMIISPAVGLNVTYQILPRLINADTNSTQTGIYNAAMFLAYGCSSVISSVICGKIFVKNKGWIIVVSIYAGMEFLNLGLIMIFHYFTSQLGFWIIIGFIRGIADYSVWVVLNMTFGKFKEVKLVYALFRFIYAIAYLVTSICVGYLPYWGVLLIDLIFVIAAVVGYCLHIINSKEPSIEMQFNRSTIII